MKQNYSDLDFSQFLKLRKVLSLRSPNIWAAFPVLEVWVDVKEFNDIASNEIPGFNERLMSWLPTMVEHRCRRGGFFERLRDGTYLGLPNLNYLPDWCMPNPQYFEVVRATREFRLPSQHPKTAWVNTAQMNMKSACLKNSGFLLNLPNLSYVSKSEPAHFQVLEC